MGKTKRLTLTEARGMTREELLSRLLEDEREIGQLEAKLYRQNAELDKVVRAKESQREALLKQLIERFVSKGESLPAPVMNEAEASSAPKGKKKGRGKGSRNFAGWDLAKRAEGIPEEIVGPGFSVCPRDGAALLPAGEDSFYRISMAPARIAVRKVVRLKFRCPMCGAIYEAPSDSAFGHSPLTPSFASWVCSEKFGLGVPLDRQAKWMSSQGLPTSTQLLSSVVLRSAELLRPVSDEIKRRLAASSVCVVNADETPLKVLGERKNGRKVSYVFVYASSWFDHPMYAYDFSLSRRMEGAERILKGFKGTIICDGYSGYEKLAGASGGDIRLQYCWAHSRRRFFDYWKTLPKSAQAGPAALPALKVIEAFDAVFDKERAMRESGMPPDDVLSERKKPGYSAMLGRLEKAVSSLKPDAGTKLADAKRYFLNHWGKGMRTFLSDGHVDLTNNLCERAVKPFAIGRRAFLFCKAQAGAEAAACIFTVVQTAKLNGLDVGAYLEWAMENSGKLGPSELVPWSESVPESCKG